jgi:hypothetical protein
MPIKAKAYIAIVIVLGALTLLTCALAEPQLPDFRRFLECFILAILASTFKIRPAGLQSSISLNFVLFIIAIATLSLTESLLIAAGCAVVQCLWRYRTRPTVVQVLFNVSALMIAVFAASISTERLRVGPAYVPGLVMAGVVLFLANTWLVSLVLALLKERSPLAIWRECHACAFPYYVAGAVVAVAISASIRVCGWEPALAMLPSVYLLYAYYDAHVSKSVLTGKGAH